MSYFHTRVDNRNMSIKPPKLRTGDTIGVVGPASPPIKERLDKGIQYLQQLGYRVKLGQHIDDTYGYLAGQDADRVQDINRMFRDPEVNAIFCTRGGYGTPRLLEQIDYDAITRHPKILVGYSDLTALQLAIFHHTQVITFSGPMVAVEMGKGISSFTERHFWEILTSEEKKIIFSGENGPLRCLKNGKSEGRLLGGCLSMICSIIGTPFLPNFEDAVLFVEDVGEEPYRIDRNFMQLKLAGILDRLNGIVFGKFEDCQPSSDTPSLTLEQVIEHVIGDLEIPVMADLPYGHVDIKYTLPVGAKVRLDTEVGGLEMIDAVVV